MMRFCSVPRIGIGVLAGLLCGVVGLLSPQETVAGPQPLPGGKARFTFCHGNFDMSGKTTARLMNLTFNGTNGTVGATSWLWDSSNNKGKVAFNSHTCTFDGQTRTGTLYTPSGWLSPSGQYYSWTGNYTFNASTGQLDISWTTGAPGDTERWTVAAVSPALARAVFLSSNYGITHGRGFGSNAPWSSYKTVSQISRGPFNYGRYIGVLSDTSGNPISVLNQPTSLNLTSCTFPSSPSPANCIHAWLSSGACSAGGCSCSTRSGTVIHVGGNNAGRPMIYNHFCACLPACSDFPAYSGGLHPYALMQVIDDNDNHVGFIGVHVQNSTTAPAFYSMAIVDYTIYP